MSEKKYTSVQYGSKETWDKHILDVPKPVREITGVAQVAGKRFAKDEMELEFMDFSINKLSPGLETPFRYRHEKQEEVYFVLEGEGELCLDNELVSLSSGTAVRVGQHVMRTIRNTSLSEPLYFLSFRAQEGRITTLKEDVREFKEFDWDDVLF